MVRTVDNRAVIAEKNGTEYHCLCGKQWRDVGHGLWIDEKDVLWDKRSVRQHGHDQAWHSDWLNQQVPTHVSRGKQVWSDPARAIYLYEGKIYLEDPTFPDGFKLEAMDAEWFETVREFLTHLILDLAGKS